MRDSMNSVGCASQPRVMFNRASPAAQTETRYGMELRSATRDNVRHGDGRRRRNVTRKARGMPILS